MFNADKEQGRFSEYSQKNFFFRILLFLKRPEKNLKPNVTDFSVYLFIL